MSEGSNASFMMEVFKYTPHCRDIHFDITLFGKLSVDYSRHALYVRAYFMGTFVLQDYNLCFRMSSWTTT